MEDLAAAALDVLKEKINATEFGDPEKLWNLHTWIVSKTDLNNGEIPKEFLPLKKAIANTFRR